MSWKTVLARAESLLGGPAPTVDLFLLGKSASTRLIERVRKLASVTDHKVVSVIYTQLRNNSGSFPNLPSWGSLFSTTSYAKQFPQSMLIPMVGQYIANHPGSDLLDLHRKMGATFASINLALALQRFGILLYLIFYYRTIVELSNLPENLANDSSWLKSMQSGNKIAVLTGDIFLADACVKLASFRIPKVHFIVVQE